MLSGGYPIQHVAEGEKGSTVTQHGGERENISF